MIPATTECTLESFHFGHLEGRQIVLDFNGGRLSSDGELLLIKQLDEHSSTTQALAQCFSDQRDSNGLKYPVSDLVKRGSAPDVRIASSDMEVVIWK